MALRVLVTTPGGTGHIHPMVPLARAMVGRGHSVLWALPDRAVGQAEQAGIRAIGTSPLPVIGPADMLQRYPELRELPPMQRPEVMFGKLFGALMAPPMLAGLSPVARDWRPDLVVSDAAELAGPIVAAELGVPGITKGFGPLLPERKVASADEELAPLWRSRGLQPRPYGGSYDHLYVDPYPPELQPQAVPHVPRRQLMRPISYTGPLDLAEELPLPAARADRPLVYVTMGTVFSDVGLLGELVAALTELDVRLLVTVGPQGDPALLGEQPAHVRVERYVPQAALLPRCDVVVSHAGSGTSVSTLEHGLPQLCLPQGADQFDNAAAISSVGAGIALMPGKATGDAVRTAVEQLLAQESYRRAARRLRASIAAMPSPAEVSAVLEEWGSQPIG
jgi:UDP:flavonoid glycosyltransferase YjiC (YdhE family)